MAARDIRREADPDLRQWSEVAAPADVLVASLRALTRDRFDVETVEGRSLVLRDRVRLVCSRICVQVEAREHGAAVMVRDAGVPLTGSEGKALALAGICLVAGMNMIAEGIPHGYWLVPSAIVGCLLLVAERIGAARRRGQEFAAVTRVVAAAIREVERGAVDDVYRGRPEVTAGAR